MTAKEFLLDNLKQSLVYLSNKGKDELRAQGHFLTGNLERSFEIEVEDLLNGVLYGQILIEDYGADLDLESKEQRQKLPSFDQHVKELYGYFQKRLSNASKTQQYFAAVGTAKRHFKGEIPTKNSYSFSKNGRRTGWIDKSLNEPQNLIEAEKILRLADFFQLMIEESVEKFIKTLKK